MYPARPSSIESKQTNSSIILMWKQPQPRGELPVNYTLRCLSTPSEVCDASATTRDTQWTLDLDYIFDDLLPYTIYEFEICSNNEVSLSNFENGGCEKFKTRTEAGGTTFFVNFIHLKISFLNTIP